jgi:hypothetical protein
LVAGGALQIATRSVAEALKTPYLFAAYCPAVLSSPDHPPPKIGMHYSQSLPASANLSLWAAEERSWNDPFRTALNEERAKAGLTASRSAIVNHDKLFARVTAIVHHGGVGTTTTAARTAPAQVIIPHGAMLDDGIGFSLV